MWRAFKHHWFILFRHTNALQISMHITSVKICSACLSAIKETLENFKLRDYQRDPQGWRTISRQSNQIFRRFSSRRRQMLGIQCITANVAWIRTCRFTGEDSSEECFPAGWCLQHYTNTDTSKMQVTIEEAQGAQSGKKICCWEKYCQMEQKT